MAIQFNWTIAIQILKDSCPWIEQQKNKNANEMLFNSTE